MLHFRQRSIKTKLTVLAATSGAVALMLGGAGFMANDWRLMRNAKVDQLRTQAELLAYNSSAAVLLRDEDAAAQLLKSLEPQETIELAALYDDDGAVVATFSRDSGQSAPPLPDWRGHRFSPDGHLEWTSHVVDNGQALGSLYLRANMNDLWAQLWDHAATATIVTLASLAAALSLSMALQRGIAKPILALADTARDITANADYSKRVTTTSNDELGALYDAFNRMLDQVECSEAAQMVAHAELENRVLERTKQLTEEITQRQQTQEALVRAKEAAEAASRAKSEFLANMSHEIRTPLNAILGFTDLLRRGAARNAEEFKSFADTVHNSGQHLLGLLNDILDLSKIEAGQMQVESIACSPYQVVAEVVSIMRARAGEKGLILDYNWTGPVPATIQTDPARLRQLLLNVVGNAVKFTEQGGVQVVAKLLADQPAPQLQIQVIDTGIGIEREKLARIFDPFCQADTSVTRRFGGTGLGLAICRRIAEALGGDVQVESEADVGSTFTILVATGPLTNVTIMDRPSGDVLPEAASKTVGQQKSLAGARILVVDDGDTNRRLIQVLLERAGAVVVQGENGQEAINFALGQPFDLVFMDMQMPVVDGYTATTRLRQAGITTPVVALTAHAMKGDEEKCRAAGCSDYLTKPIDRDRLLAVAVACVGARLATTGASPSHAPEALPSQAPLISTLPLDDAEFCEIVREFIDRFRQRLVEMRELASQGDYQRLAEMAHWLKGAGGSAGFNDLTEAARTLEQAAKSGDRLAAERAVHILERLADRIQTPQLS